VGFGDYHNYTEAGVDCMVGIVFGGMGLDAQRLSLNITTMSITIHMSASVRNDGED